MTGILHGRWEKNLFRILVMLATLQMFYTIYWLGLEVLGRLGLWPDMLVNFDLAAFLRSESEFNLIAILVFTFLYSVGYFLILWRKAAAVWFLALAFIVGRLDWIGLTFNLVFDNFVGGAYELVLQAIIVLLGWDLRGRGVLR
ncbi:hypothetical protein [uncultured Maricaulis sp.]|uniref:hypothetical protein n=1 Tax=uncultured Maricaulis sp. TaxID=174710 RepID=UPI0030D84119|tara:strand:- start:8326 stop:8754 length:429 start_codon:yes stop_codon:yes gene_type:complete